ncbi:hypothetical protein WJX72_000083 [[Myrmecia] bisecta]|uniref:Methylmalonic aciduria and homocystinuria type D protein n=1 Tax=[Myrmecia] bisecta TaxID=41462 RepID=A0AAW1Q6A2_9CHLO
MQLSEPTVSPCGIEYSVHACPKTHEREFAAVFSGVQTDGLLIIPTCQRAGLDLVQTGEQIEDEKDRLLERFMTFAKAICDMLLSQGHWADYIDPCSGLPMIHRSGMTTYSEVDALATLLGYKTQNAGCCKILLHPQWGSAVYPASIFAKAPLREVQAAIQAAEPQALAAWTLGKHL